MSSEYGKYVQPSGEDGYGLDAGAAVQFGGATPPTWEVSPAEGAAVAAGGGRGAGRFSAEQVPGLVPQPSAWPGRHELRGVAGAAVVSSPQQHAQVDASRSAAAGERITSTGAAMRHVAARPPRKLAPGRVWRSCCQWLMYRKLRFSRDRGYEDDLKASIKRPVATVPGTELGYRCAVVSLKGGVGKTAITMLVGSALADICGAKNVAAIDADPSGNLVDRANKQTNNTVSQLVASANDLKGPNSLRLMINENDVKLQVVAGVDYVNKSRPLKADEYQAAMAVVSSKNPIVVTDCGVELHTALSRAVLDSAWSVIVVSDASPDGAIKAGKTLDWLRAHGYQDLVGRSVVAVNHTEAGKGSADVAQIKAKFEDAVGRDRVFELPYSDHVERGGEIDIAKVTALMRVQVTALAAAVSEWFDQPRQV